MDVKITLYLLLLFVLNAITRPSLDYSNEVKKIFKIAKIKNETSREDRLVRMLIAQGHQRVSDAIAQGHQRVVDAEKRADDVQQRADNFKEEIGGLKYKKEVCEGIARDAVCGRRFRYYMESFGVDYGVQQGDIRKLSENFKKACNKIYRRIDEKRLRLETAIFNLQSLCSDDLSTLNTFNCEPINSTWCENVFTELQKEHITQTTWTSSGQKDYFKLPKLGDLVAEFYYAKNATNAVEILQRQCSSCFWTTNYPEIDEENDSIDELVLQWSDTEKKNFVPEVKIGNKIGNKDGVSPEEHQLLKNLLTSGKYFIKKNKHFRYCAEVFYLGESEFIRNIVKKMRTRWNPEPGKRGLPFLVERFCMAFHSLFNRISRTDVHAPVDIIAECTPNSTDYKKFVNKIAPAPELKDDYLFIAEVLGIVV